MDDVIIYSNSVEGHIKHVVEILTTLAESSVTLKMKKCTYFSDKVEYLGHAIRPGKPKVDNAHTASLVQAKPPSPKANSFPSLCFVTYIDGSYRTLQSFPIG